MSFSPENQSYCYARFIQENNDKNRAHLFQSRELLGMRENWIKTRGLFFTASCHYQQQVPAVSTDDTAVLKSWNSLPTAKKLHFDM